MNNKLQKIATFTTIIFLIASFFTYIPFARSSTTWSDNTMLYSKTHVINPLADASTNYQINFTAHYGSGVDSEYDVYLDSHSRTDFYYLLRIEAII
jgi:hypothetical protein